MNRRAVYAFVAFVCVIAVALATRVDWHQLTLLSSVDYWGLATLILLGLVAEGQALPIKMGGTASGSSIAFLPIFTIVLLFGPAATVLSMIISGPIVEFLIRKKTPVRANFNIGQYILSTSIAGLVYSQVGGIPLMVMDPAVRSGAIVAQFGPFVLFGAVFLLVNNTAVAAVIALSQGLVFREVWGRLVGRSGTNIFSDLLIGPIAVAVAALYLQVWVVGLFLAILPLLFVRRSYLTTHQLLEANRNLLKALVKAIETRDPYTSGHSLRVSHLAGKIAEELGLGTAAVERIKTAALLHDVGKIEAVYTGILAKPDKLTEEERGVIQSHVTKGEELLRTLSSLPEPILLSVRHHHEREDGQGYPDGLLADQIPIGARIISVCDAVDAMLSDRPYRKALPITAVLQQLNEHCGTQFAPHIVEALVESGLLGEYADMMRVTRAGESDMAITHAVDEIDSPIPHRLESGRHARATLRSVQGFGSA
jgi:putative nucleotidyltransferase with HDIG domain